MLIHWHLWLRFMIHSFRSNTKSDLCFAVRRGPVHCGSAVCIRDIASKEGQIVFELESWFVYEWRPLASLVWFALAKLPAGHSCDLREWRM